MSSKSAVGVNKCCSNLQINGRVWKNPRKLVAIPATLTHQVPTFAFLAPVLFVWTCCHGNRLLRGWDRLVGGTPESSQSDRHSFCSFCSLISIATGVSNQTPQRTPLLPNKSERSETAPRLLRVSCVFYAGNPGSLGLQRPFSMAQMMGFCGSLCK